MVDQSNVLDQDDEKEVVKQFILASVDAAYQAIQERCERESKETDQKKGKDEPRIEMVDPNTLEWSPLIEKSRDYTAQEFSDLCASIDREGGVIQPIMRIANPHRPDYGKIFDGRHRLRAAQKLGLSYVPVLDVHSWDYESLRGRQALQPVPVEVGPIFDRVAQQVSTGEIDPNLSKDAKKKIAYIYKTLDMAEDALKRNVSGKTRLNKHIAKAIERAAADIRETEIICSPRTGNLYRVYTYAQGIRALLKLNVGAKRPEQKHFPDWVRDAWDVAYGPD